MRIFGLMVARNEADIIGQTLLDALQWCDRISVLDNGSTDDTGHVLEGLAKSYPSRIDLAGCLDAPFADDLRAVPFRRLFPEAQAGDWWCRLDADEMYPNDPKGFLSALPKMDCRVNAIHMFYEFTDLDWARWQAGNETISDRERPIGDRRRYYRANYQELRFMRHHPRLTWHLGEPWPRPRGPLSDHLILVRHFRARDPIQLQQRLHARFGEGSAAHWRRYTPDDWKQEIVPHEHCEYDDHSGDFQVDYQQFAKSRGYRFGQGLRRLGMRLGMRW